MSAISPSGFQLEPAREHPATVTYANAPAPRATIFFSDLLAAIDRRFVPGLLAFLAAASLVVLVALILPAKYTGIADIMLDTRQREIVKLEAVLSGLPADSAVVDSEVEVVRSRALASGVITKLGLDRDPEFGYDPTQTAPAQANASMVPAATAASATGTGPAPVNHELATDIFLSQLGVRRLGLTYVIEIAFKSTDANKAARIANAVAEAYLEQQQSSKFNATRGASAWLSQRVGELAQRVRVAEEKVVSYKAAHGLLSTQGVNQTEAAISELNTKLAEARAEQAQKEARLTAAQRQFRSGNGGSLGDATMVSGTIQELRRQEADVIRRQADLETRYGPQHPELIKVHQEKKELDGAINLEIQRIVGSLEADASAARGRTTSLASSIANYQGALATSNEAAVEMNQLDRDAQAARTLYEAFLSRLQQTSAQTGSEAADAQVISRAAPPKSPSFPTLTMVAALALFFGIGAGTTTIAFAELRDRSFKSMAEVEAEFGLPVLENIPATRHSRPANLIVEKPLSRFTEAFRNLKTSAPFNRVGEGQKIIAICSAIPGEGKTTCALALGRTMSMTRSRVLIVDCDTRACSLTNLVASATEPKAGILEVLAHQAPLDEVLLRDELSPVTILPAIKSDLTARDLFLGDAADRLFDLLASCFDVIILDTPPLLPLADTRAIVRHADVTLLLARWCSTSRHAIADALRLLRSAEAELSGFLLTRVDLHKQSRIGYAAKPYDYSSSFRQYYNE
jgi:succinoglycan biosynthesis transport protein ExoP